MSTLSTHVLDTSVGHPAAGVRVTLETEDGAEVDGGITNADGRLPNLSARALDAGAYRLRFSVDEYFRMTGRECFYPEVVVIFRVDGRGHYHVPLLVSPFGYSTYRGS